MMGNPVGRVLSKAADWLFPPRCAGCGRLGGQWCADCQAQATVLGEPCCRRCGYPLPEPAANCPDCAEHDFRFSAARAWGVYEGRLRKAILKLKHKGNASLAQAFSQPLAGLYQAQAWRADLLVPMPLHPQRQAQRGYNPVDLLAAPLAASLGLPLRPGALQRTRHTRPQMELDLGQRWANVRDAFAADAQAVSGRRILILDDIMTSGATLDAAAQALRAAGAPDVYALALARAL